MEKKYVQYVFWYNGKERTYTTVINKVLSMKNDVVTAYFYGEIEGGVIYDIVTGDKVIPSEDGLVPELSYVRCHEVKPSQVASQCKRFTRLGVLNYKSSLKSIKKNSKEYYDSIQRALNEEFVEDEAKKLIDNFEKKYRRK